MCVCISPAVLVALLGTRNRFGVGSTGAVLLCGGAQFIQLMGSNVLAVEPLNTDSSREQGGKSLGWIFHLLIFSAMPISFRIFCTRVVQVSTMGAVQYVTVYYLFQLTQVLAWALIAIASVYYINAVMEPEDAVKETSVSTLTGF